MNLGEYYKNNIKKTDYFYYKHHDTIALDTVFHQFIYYDDKEIIEKLRTLSYPSNEYSELENTEYLLICYYLNNEEYIIEEFPDILARPTSIKDFSYNIRTLIIQESGYNGSVAWESRRHRADSLTIKKVSNSTKIILNTDLEKAFQTISNRNAIFEQMSQDEKLQEICNAIEHLANENGKWLTLNYEDESLNFIDNTIITTYRKKIQCFRHATKESIIERKTFTENQKIFLINYGITLCDLICSLLKQNP